MTEDPNVFSTGKFPHAQFSFPPWRTRGGKNCKWLANEHLVCFIWASLQPGVAFTNFYFLLKTKKSFFFFFAFFPKPVEERLLTSVAVLSTTMITWPTCHVLCGYLLSWTFHVVWHVFNLDNQTTSNLKQKHSLEILSPFWILQMSTQRDAMAKC